MDAAALSSPEPIRLQPLVAPASPAVLGFSLPRQSFAESRISRPPTPTSSLRAALENDGALAPGDLDGGCEGGSRFGLVADGRAPAGTPRANDRSPAGRNRRPASSMPAIARSRWLSASAGPAGGEQHFRRQPEIILRQRTGRRGIGDLGVDQPYGVSLGAPDRGGPAGQNQTARAPWRQAELFGQRDRAMRDRVGGLAFAAKLVADTAIVQPMREAVRMIEHFGQRHSLPVMRLRLLLFAG